MISGETVDRPRKILERVCERRAGGHVRLTTAREVRRHEVKAVGEQWVSNRRNMCGARKAVQ